MMEDNFPLLDALLVYYLREKLPSYEQYTRSREESQALWNRFCACHGEALKDEVLALIDAQELACDYQSAGVFRFGLALGLELGALSPAAREL